MKARSGWLCLAVCLTGSAVPALATPIPLRGTAWLGSDVQHFRLDGEFSTDTGWPGGSSLFGVCDGNAACDFTRTIETFPGPGYTLASFGDHSTSLVVGSLEFSGLAPGGAMSLPVSVRGRLTGFGGDDVTQPGRTLFDFWIEGSGGLQLTGFAAGDQTVYEFGTYTFEATATPMDMPEPGTALLLAAGLVVLFCAPRRKSHHRSSV